MYSLFTLHNIDKEKEKEKRVKKREKIIFKYIIASLMLRN